MKIRELLKGVNPEECGHGKYLDKKGKPFCPVAKGLARHHIKIPSGKELSLCEFLNIDRAVLVCFTEAWDMLRLGGLAPKEAFRKALAEAVTEEQGRARVRKELAKVEKVKKIKPE